MVLVKPSSQVVGNKQHLYTFAINHALLDSISANNLAQSIEAYARHGSGQDGTTIHLDVSTPQIPQVVIDALGKFRGFGLGVVVSHNGISSHSGNVNFDSVTLELIRSVARDGNVWDPIAGKFVVARP